MKTLEGEYSVADCCEALGASRSGYYAWRTRLQGARAEANATLASQIESVFDRRQRRYGSPRITRELRRLGHRCSENRVARLMRDKRLSARPKRRFLVQTTQSDHALPIAPNRLADAPAVTVPDRVWVGDITYVQTDEGWLYVAGILDAWSRRIVGWAMADHLGTELPLAALQMALKQRSPAAGLLHHSDRGCQYASDRYREALQACASIPSMSRAGNCYDNAMMESFWATLKRELVYARRFATRADAARALFEYIEVFYNRERLHSSLGYQSPVDFETMSN
jgi:transposase InsO family protein